MVTIIWVRTAIDESKHSADEHRFFKLYEWEFVQYENYIITMNFPSLVEPVKGD